MGLLLNNMVKTLRIDNADIHKELLKIQGEMQAKTGEYTSIEDVIDALIKNFRKRK